MRHIVLLLFIFTGFSAYSQKETDVILKVDLTSIVVIVDEIGENEITYFLTSDIAKRSPFRIDRTKVWKIIFANNDVEIITPPSISKQPAFKPKASDALSSKSVADKSNSLITSEKSEQENLKQVSGESSNLNTSKFEKKKNRIFIAGSLTRENQGYYTEMGLYEYHSGFKVGYEQFAFQKSPRPNGKKSNAGFGVEVNNFYEYYIEYNDLTLDNDSYRGTKHLLSPYIFREFDIKKIVTLGISAGPYASLTWVGSASSNDINPNQSAMKIGGGLHSGEYIQKYMAKNRHGKRTLYMRIGFDQYMTSHSGFNCSVYLSFGF